VLTEDTVQISAENEFFAKRGNHHDYESGDDTVRRVCVFYQKLHQWLLMVGLL